MQRQRQLFDQERANWEKKEGEFREEIKSILINKEANQQYSQFQKLNDQLQSDIDKDKKIEQLQKEIEEL